MTGGTNSEKLAQLLEPVPVLVTILAVVQARIVHAAHLKLEVQWVDCLNTSTCL